MKREPAQIQRRDPQLQTSQPTSRGVFVRPIRFALLAGASIAAFLMAVVVGCQKPSASPQAAEKWMLGDKVVLGSPHLTAGIPGSGPLTLAEIKRWLDDPANHEPLAFRLPPGLHDAESLVRVPKDDPMTPAKIELGRQLFFDRRLSRDSNFACATCHIPEQHYSAHLVMPEIGRNPNPSFNRIFGNEQFWDGRAATLEEQPESPLKNKFEMNTTVERCLLELQAIEGYRIQFERIYGRVDFKALGSALAAFQRALVTGCSPWDAKRGLEAFAQRDQSSLTDEEKLIRAELRRVAADRPMSDDAKRGEALFFSDRARCSWCHSGPNLTDEQYHNVGVGMHIEVDPDLGRYIVTSKAADRGAFKTPSLRNVANTAPYMHDGETNTLREAVDWFCQGGYAHDDLDVAVVPLDLTLIERDELVAFLRSLSGPLPKVETARLPE